MGICSKSPRNISFFCQVLGATTCQAVEVAKDEGL